LNRRDSKIFNYYFIYSFLLLNPIWVLYLLKYGFSIYKITILDVIYYMTITLLSFPSGSIVDKIGRVYSLSISSLVTGIGILLFGLFPTFIGVSISYVFWGFGNALNSTAIETISYEYATMRGIRYLRFFGIVNFMGSVSVAVASLIGGAISAIVDFRFVIILTSIFVFISGYLALSIKEVHIKKKNDSKGSFLNYIWNRNILSSIIIRVALLLDFNILILFKQPYYVMLGLDTVIIGLLFFIDVLIRGLSFLLTQDIRIFRKNNFGAMLFLGSGIFFTIYIPGIYPGILAVTLLIINSGLFGFYTNLLSKDMNDNIPSHIRGQILSIVYLITSLFTAIAEPELGYLASLKGIVFTILIFSFIFFILLVSGILVKIAHKRKYVFPSKWI